MKQKSPILLEENGALRFISKPFANLICLLPTAGTEVFNGGLNSKQKSIKIQI